MFPFVVLVSKHVWSEKHTTQFDVYVEADSRPHARELVIIQYPPEYLVYGKGTKHEALIAFFTGEVYGYRR